MPLSIPVCPSLCTVYGESTPLQISLGFGFFPGKGKRVQGSIESLSSFIEKTRHDSSRKLVHSMDVHSCGWEGEWPKGES